MEVDVDGRIQLRKFVCGMGYCQLNVTFFPEEVNHQPVSYLGLGGSWTLTRSILFGRIDTEHPAELPSGYPTHKPTTKNPSNSPSNRQIRNPTVRYLFCSFVKINSLSPTLSLTVSTSLNLLILASALLLLLCKYNPHCNCNH